MTCDVMTFFLPPNKDQPTPNHNGKESAITHLINKVGSVKQVSKVLTQIGSWLGCLLRYGLDMQD